MESHSDWYGGIAKEIGLYNNTLGKKDFKKYKLELLSRVARRVDDFSAACGECQMFKQDITGLLQEIGYVVGMAMSREKRKSYFRRINIIIKHLQKQHKLVSEGHYIGIWMAIGTGIGVAIGTALGNPGIGPGVGIAIGLAIGKYLDNKAKRKAGLFRRGRVV